MKEKLTSNTIRITDKYGALYSAAHRAIWATQVDGGAVPENLPSWA